MAKVFGKKPKSTGRTIDYRKTHWGHNLSIQAEKKSGLYRGACWTYPRPRVGDEVLWESRFGTVEAIVTEVEYCRDPDDMAFIRLRVTNRKELMRKGGDE